MGSSKETSLAEWRLAKWRGTIGELPEGFFLTISRYGRFLQLCYNGEGFREILQPGGRKSEAGAEFAQVASYNIEESWSNLEESCMAFMKECVERAQKALAAVI